MLHCSKKAKVFAITHTLTINNIENIHWEKNCSLQRQERESDYFFMFQDNKISFIEVFFTI